MKKVRGYREFDITLFCLVDIAIISVLHITDLKLMYAQEFVISDKLFDKLIFTLTLGSLLQSNLGKQVKT